MGTLYIPDSAVKTTTDTLLKKHGDASAQRIKNGVRQVADLWRESDGSPEAFTKFCLTNYTHDAKKREALFNSFSKNIESLLGHFNKINLDFQWKMHIDEGELYDIDKMFAGFNPYAHWRDDFYKNKIAFITVLNFPFHSLADKKKQGPDWSSKQWAYARVGDMFTARVPSHLLQEAAVTGANADMYIMDYNIFMGHVLSNKGKKLFPEKMVLLSHWNLRDELKSHYATGNLEKQQVLYQVMKRIISQEIPQKVINSGDWDWDPFKNKVLKDGKDVEFKSEADDRYRHILEGFKVQKKIDKYYPTSEGTFIQRQFDGNLEFSQKEVETLFDRLLSSPQVKKVAKLIRKRIKRKLQPFDIWYNGFRASSGITEDKLDEITQKRYPDTKALKADLARLLVILGFTKEKADFLAARIDVDDARGSGHAWGAQMKAENAHLRTRVSGEGMNYKGYNIAIHEFGHNVEQTISLHDVEHYIMNGVPNTGFTEALAFVFQARDLELLGIEKQNPLKKHFKALDDFWSMYEIMGVSMVEMKVWKWMYANPDADPAALKAVVIKTAKEVWNKYYASVFGMKDQEILGIYSHMVSSPVYLHNYCYGHLIDFQLGRHLEGKDFGKEVERIFSAGRLIPQLWMKNATGKEIGIEPVLEAVDAALKQVRK
ncbi:MAG: hypothetical protein GY765_02580 [bacterium]|nr:hypothetical protein [bacterium]